MVELARFFHVLGVRARRRDRRRRSRPRRRPRQARELAERLAEGSHTATPELRRLLEHRPSATANYLAAILILDIIGPWSGGRARNAREGADQG